MLNNNMSIYCVEVGSIVTNVVREMHQRVLLRILRNGCGPNN